MRFCPECGELLGEQPEPVPPRRGIDSTLERKRESTLTDNPWPPKKPSAGPVQLEMESTLYRGEPVPVRRVASKSLSPYLHPLTDADLTLRGGKA